jgi:hypothetical protein
MPDAAQMTETAIRRNHFIMMEVINDMGIKKGGFFATLTTLFVACMMVWLRMIIHYLS